MEKKPPIFFFLCLVLSLVWCVSLSGDLDQVIRLNQAGFVSSSTKVFCLFVFCLFVLCEFLFSLSFIFPQQQQSKTKQIVWIFTNKLTNKWRIFSSVGRKYKRRSFQNTNWIFEWKLESRICICLYF